MSLIFGLFCCQWFKKSKLGRTQSIFDQTSEYLALSFVDVPHQPIVSSKRNRHSGGPSLSLSQSQHGKLALPILCAQSGQDTLSCCLRTQNLGHNIRWMQIHKYACSNSSWNGNKNQYLHMSGIFQSFLWPLALGPWGRRALDVLLLLFRGIWFPLLWRTSVSEKTIWPLHAKI